MTVMHRVSKIAAALFMLLCAWILLYLGEDGFQLVALILGMMLTVYGIRSLLFYFTMARHMVDGRGILYRGMILLDLGIFTLSVADDARIIIVFYLLGAHAFSGTLDILRALEARRFEAPSWRLNLTEGAVNLAVAVAAAVCGLVLKNTRDVMYLYVAGVLYSAVMNFISAFRKTAIVYIP